MTLIIKHLANQTDQSLVLVALTTDDFKVAKFNDSEYLQNIKRPDQAKQLSQDVCKN